MIKIAGIVRKTTEKAIWLARVANEKGLYHLMSANFLARFLGFASQIVVAWLLTPADMGRIKIMQSFMSVFIVLSAFGFNISILKLCSENRSNEEKNYLFQKGNTYSIIPQIITYLLIVALTTLGLLSSDKIVNSLFLIFAIGIFPLTIDSNILSYLQSLRRVKQYSKVQIITKVLGVLIVVVLTYTFSLKGYVMAIVIGYFITLIILYSTNRDFFSTNQTPVANPFKLHFNLAYYSTFTNFIGMINLSIDIFIINYLSTDKLTIGYYSFATVFIGMLGIFTRTILQITLPYFSEKSHSFDEWYKSYKKYNKTMVLLLLGILLLSLLFVPLFLKLAINGKYESSIPFFILLSIGWFFRDNSSLRGNALLGLGKIKYNFYVSALSFLFNIIILFFSYRIFGIYGVAYGMILCGVVLFVLNHLYFNKVIRLNKRNIAVNENFNNR